MSWKITKNGKERYCSNMKEIADEVGCHHSKMKYHFCTAKKKQRVINGYKIIKLWEK